jgi:hypothetical protein
MALRVESQCCNSLVAIGGIADIGMRQSRKARLRMTRSGGLRVSYRNAKGLFAPDVEVSI